MDNIEEFINSLKEPIEELQNLQKVRFEYIKNEIEILINNKIKNKKLIETKLDELLNMAYIDYDMITNTFYKLINYYKTIDLEASIFYLNEYLEIDDDDMDDKQLIKSL